MGTPELTAHKPGNAFARLWITPIRELLPVAARVKDKPLSEVTLTELTAWFAIVGYISVTGILGGMLAGNIIRVAIGGR
jgi:hypothetical protein